MRILRLLCPHCGAPLAPPSGATELTCQYCTQMFRVAEAREQQARAPHSLGIVLLVVGSVVGLVVLAVVLLAVIWAYKVDPVGSSRDTQPRPPASGTTVDLETLIAKSKPTPAAAEGAAKVTFTLDEKHVSSIGALWFYGRVKNESSVVVGKPQVRAVLLDDQGEELGSHLGYPHRSDLGPGETAPMTVLVTKPPSYASVKFEAKARALDGFASPDLRAIVVEAMKPRKEEYSGWQFEGKLRNRELVSVSFPQVEIVLSSASGKVMGLCHTYAEDRELPPGAASRFQTSCTPIGEFVKTTYRGWARPK